MAWLALDFRVLCDIYYFRVIHEIFKPVVCKYHNFTVYSHVYKKSIK